MEIRGRVVVFSIVGCPHCLKAKTLLRELQLPYYDISLDSFPQYRRYLKEKTGKYTVPQIFFNNICIGGNDDLLRVKSNESEWNVLLDEIITNSPPADAPEVPDPESAVIPGVLEEFTCEPDEFALLMQDLKASGLIKDHRKGLIVHKNTFTGKEFVDWITEKKQMGHDCAVEMGQALIDRHFGTDLNKEVVFRDDQTLYRLLEDNEVVALNAGPTSVCEPSPIDLIGEDIRRVILSIYSAFLSENGKKVNYEGIARSSEFAKYKRLTKELIRVPVEMSSHEEKLAFFINIYNALVIHANIVKGSPTNLWQRYKFFNRVSYIIGGHPYSLQDIENGVLRGNKRGVGMLFKPFGKSDPRIRVVLQKPEPLIHFALVCGAKSCPPIKTFSAQGINEELKMAAEAFLDGDDAIQINMAKKDIKLSMIFKWYRSDFGEQNDEVLQFIYDHMADGEKQQHLSELLRGKKYKISHLSYDWSVNT